MKLPVKLLCSVLLLSVSVLSQEDEAAAAGQEISAGTRDAQCGNYSLPACTREYVPVCGDDENTYSNECMLCSHNWEKKTTVRVLRKGTCEDTSE